MANTITSNLVSIKAAIAYAHDELHNRKALGKQDFEERGLSEQAFTQWCDYVEELRVVVAEYNKLAQDKDATEKAIQTAQGKIWSAWRAVLKEGTESDYNKNFFVRKADATMIANFCGLHAMDTAIGRQFTTKGKTDFRKAVETVIGIRMAGNALLDDEKRDLIAAYEGAVKTIQKNQDALEDSKDKKGKVVAGLRTLASIAEKRVTEEEKFLAELGVKKEVIDKRLETLKYAAEEAKAAVADAQKAIAEAEKTKAEKEKDYNKVIALLKSVGDFQ